MMGMTECGSKRTAVSLCGVCVPMLPMYHAFQFFSCELCCWALVWCVKLLDSVWLLVSVQEVCVRRLFCVLRASVVVRWCLSVF
jgi:hypothetical protein